MGLIQCPTCTKEISDRAPVCIHCGEPIKSTVETAYGGGINLRDPVHVIGIVVCILVLIGALIMMLQRMP